MVPPRSAEIAVRISGRERNNERGKQRLSLARCANSRSRIVRMLSPRERELDVNSIVRGRKLALARALRCAQVAACARRDALA